MQYDKWYIYIYIWYMQLSQTKLGPSLNMKGQWVWAFVPCVAPAHLPKHGAMAMPPVPAAVAEAATMAPQMGLRMADGLPMAPAEPGPLRHGSPMAPAEPGPLRHGAAMTPADPGQLGQPEPTPAPPGVGHGMVPPEESQPRVVPAIYPQPREPPFPPPHHVEEEPAMKRQKTTRPPTCHVPDATWTWAGTWGDWSCGNHFRWRAISASHLVIPGSSLQGQWQWGQPALMEQAFLLLLWTNPGKLGIGGHLGKVARRFQFKLSMEVRVKWVPKKVRMSRLPFGVCTATATKLLVVFTAVAFTSLLWWMAMGTLNTWCWSKFI